MWLALLFIIAGVLILAMNLGLVGWGALLDLLQLWPVLLIAIGVDILLRGRYRLAVVAGAVLLGALLYSGGGLPGAPSAETHVIAHAISGAERAVIRLEVPISRLRIAALEPTVGSNLAAPGNLVEGEIRTARGERLRQEFRVSNGVAFLTLASEQPSKVSFSGRDERIWELRLSPRIPLDLDIDAGVGDSEIDLGALQLRTFRFDAGVGKVYVTLPASGRYHADFETGVGTTTVRIPEGVAAHIEVSTGIGGVRVSGNFIRAGDTYTSPDFATAEHRAVVQISGGVGAIIVEQVALGGG